ncbi:hypothetical protein TRVA0_056S00386 [Trichomonascus vanleenenianus]|uniref:uncharacterized protein n=1 Tax=Trichomonascus vanleenenianus TaxID=2268995 RepID=UPI003ECAB1C6
MELGTVTRLVEDLLNTVDNNRQALGEVETEAEKALKYDELERKLIEKYNIEIPPQNKEEEEEGDEEATEGEDLHSEYARNIELKLELQDHELFHDKVGQLVGRYEKTLSLLDSHIRGYLIDYDNATAHLLNSYESRLAEEKHTYSDMVGSHEGVVESLSMLRNSLKSASDELGKAVESTKKTKE